MAVKEKTTTVIRIYLPKDFNETANEQGIAFAHLYRTSVNKVNGMAI